MPPPPESATACGLSGALSAKLRVALRSPAMLGVTVTSTLQLAAGMNLHIFTTGRGTPYGLAQVPVIKVATRSDLARRWHDLMDLDAGQIATGAATIEDTGWELFRLMLDVASGKRRTWAEQWKLANALTLFNPAPVT